MSIVVTSVKTVQLVNHEVEVLSDGSITIEHPLYQYLHDERLDHIRLPVGELADLYDLIGSILNK